MSSPSRDFRGTLESTVRNARAAAEAGRGQGTKELQVRPVALELATLRDTAEVEVWTVRQKQTLL